MTDVPSLPDRARSRAVLIGTSSFEYLPPLPAVRNNLADLRAVLTDPEHGVLAPQNCEVIDDPRSVRDFMAALRRVVGRTDDFLLVYYAGHGLRHDTKDELYLSVRDTDADALAESAVRFETVREVLEASPARANLLVLDCCYSGMALGTMAGSPIETRELEVRGSAVIASSAKNKKSHSPPNHRNTAFTERMVSFLDRGSPIAGEQLTVNSLYKRLSVALVRDEFPRPLIRVTDTSGDLLLRRPAGKSKRIDPPTVPRTRPPALPPLPRPAPGPPPVSPTPVPPTNVARTAGRPLDLSIAGRFPQGSKSAALASQTRVRIVQALWLVTSLCVAMTVGGLFGMIVGEKPSANTSPGAVMGGALLMGAFSVAVLVGLRHRWRDLRRSPVPPLLSRSVAGRVILVVGIALCVLVAVIGPLASSSNDSVTTTVSAIVFLLEGAGGCAYLLIKGQRLNRR